MTAARLDCATSKAEMEAVLETEQSLQAQAASTIVHILTKIVIKLQFYNSL